VITAWGNRPIFLPARVSRRGLAALSDGWCCV